MYLTKHFNDMGGVIKGRDLTIWVEESETNLKRLAKDRSCSISVEAETKTVTGKTNGKWVKKRAIRLSWSMTSSHLYTHDGFDYLFEKMVNMEPVIVTFSPIRSTIYDEQTWDDTKRYRGEAYITQLSGSADLGDIGQVSISLEGSGPLSRVDFTDESGRIFDRTFDDKFE